MALDPDTTEVHQADNLSEASKSKAQKPTVRYNRTKSGVRNTVFSVHIGNKVIAVEARTAQDAANKAKKLYNKKREK